MILSHDQEPDNWKMAEKGYSILRHIENILGEEKILIFLKGNKWSRWVEYTGIPIFFWRAKIFFYHFEAYIKEFSYKALTTEDWKAFLYKHFSDEKEKLDQVDWQKWFHQPGLAPVKGQYDTSLADICTQVSSYHSMGTITPITQKKFLRGKPL